MTALMSKRRTIGALAKEAGVNVETVRYYERRGLLEQPEQEPDQRWRDYPDEALSLLCFIKRAQQLGFSLKEIERLIAYRHSSPHTCDQVRKEATEKILDIDAKIRDLTAIKSSLKTLVERCAQRGPDLSCPIIESLARGDPRNSER